MSSTGRKNFDTLATTWDDEPRRLRLARDVAAAVLREIPVRPEWDVLDYGAGTGLVTLALRPYVRRIVAMDSSRAMLSVLEQKIAAQGVDNVVVEHGNVEDRAGAIEPRFDLVVASMTLHHVPEPLDLLRPLHRWLRRGGHLAIADLDEDGGRFHDSREGVFHDGFDRAAFGRLLEAAGFGSVRVATAATVTKESPEREPESFGVFLAMGVRG